jgi:DNA-nicking Smr family endonuclease
MAEIPRSLASHPIRNLANLTAPILPFSTMAKPPFLPPEDTSWDDITRTTRPLKPTSTTGPGTHQNHPSSPQKASHSYHSTHFLAPPESPRPIVGWHDHPPFPILSLTADCLAGHVSNFEPGLFKNLQKGLIRPTLSLDLHGFTSPDAWRATVDFLHYAYNNSHRCVLIIPGKGRGSGPEGDMGAVKYQLPSWLSGHPRVQAFHTAIKADGGSGAVYTYLQRNRL